MGRCNLLVLDVAEQCWPGRWRMSKNRTQWQQIALFLQEQSPRRKVTPPPVSKRKKAVEAFLGVAASVKTRMQKGAA